MPVIDGNVIRTLRRVKTNPRDMDHLVDPEYHKDILEILQPCEGSKDESQFDLQEEFRQQYRIVKSYITSMGEIQTKEDIDVLKEAQKFLSFILKNEEKLADIQAVKNFKEAVLQVLDDESPELRDRVIRKLGNV